MWGLVNLLPLWPLDGGQATQILLSLYRPRPRPALGPCHIASGRGRTGRHGADPGQGQFLPRSFPGLFRGHQLSRSSSRSTRPTRWASTRKTTGGALSGVSKSEPGSLEPKIVSRMCRPRPHERRLATAIHDRPEVTSFFRRDNAQLLNSPAISWRSGLGLASRRGYSIREISQKRDPCVHEENRRRIQGRVGAPRALESPTPAGPRPNQDSSSCCPSGTPIRPCSHVTSRFFPCGPTWSFPRPWFRW